MCLIVFAYNTHPDYPLILVANRDEFYKRPTLSAHWWDRGEGILAGKDLKGGGTWMGVNKKGSWAALTNYREVDNIRTNAPSRGPIITSYLTSDISTEKHIEELAESGMQYNGFNVLMGNHQDVYYYSNRGSGPQKLEKGVYGLSNHLLNTEWPKVGTAVSELHGHIQKPTLDIDGLFNIMRNNLIASDQNLPATGVSLDWERRLSAIFIKSPEYGTRVSTVLLLNRRGEVYFEERGFVPEEEARIFQFEINPKTTTI